jgi:hypothetical protein
VSRSRRPPSARCTLSRHASRRRCRRSDPESGRRRPSIIESNKRNNDGGPAIQEGFPSREAYPVTGTRYTVTFPFPTACPRQRRDPTRGRSADNRASLEPMRTSCESRSSRWASFSVPADLARRAQPGLTPGRHSCRPLVRRHVAKQYQLEPARRMGTGKSGLRSSPATSSGPSPAHRGTCGGLC